MTSSCSSASSSSSVVSTIFLGRGGFVWRFVLVVERFSDILEALGHPLRMKGPASLGWMETTLFDAFLLPAVRFIGARVIHAMD